MKPVPAAPPRRRVLRTLFSGRSRTAPSSSSSPFLQPPRAPAAAAADADAAPRLLTEQTQLPTRRRLPGVWFTATRPAATDGDRKPDDRTVKLGKTLRILQERLPTLLQSPLPAEILSPSISLHLFPSTHPHLPAVSGRVAYMAALWTSPLAWGRVPIVGSVQLEILSERMTAGGWQPPWGVPPPPVAPAARPGGDEQLVVRWRTISRGIPFLSPSSREDGAKSGGSGSGSGSNSSSSGVVGTSQAVDDPKEFTGLFIFTFDSEGRILSHTIEHVEEGGEWERSVGARFVGLTDWLLAGIRNGGSSGNPGGVPGRGGNTPLPAFELQDPRKLR